MHKHKRRSERGQGLVEYALILVLVAVVVILSLSVAGQKIGEIFCTVSLKLGGKVPNLPVCVDPRVSFVGIGNGATLSTPINIEVLINDDKGGFDPNITSVEFYLNGSLVYTENYSRWCLGGTLGNGNCKNLTPATSPGTYILRVVATDQDHNTGES